MSAVLGSDSNPPLSFCAALEAEALPVGAGSFLSVNGFATTPFPTIAADFDWIVNVRTKSLHSLQALWILYPPNLRLRSPHAGALSFVSCRRLGSVARPDSGMI